jgi:hypothetical protein
MDFQHVFDTINRQHPHIRKPDQQLQHRERIIGLGHSPIIAATPPDCEELVKRAKEDLPWATVSGKPDVQLVPFPIPGVVGTIGGCKVFEGKEFTVLRDALKQATELTYFTENDAIFEINARPLLPNEAGCFPIPKYDLPR